MTPWDFHPLGPVGWFKGAVTPASIPSLILAHRYEDLLKRIDDYLIEMVDENGRVKGGPDVPWTSTEHNEGALAYLTARVQLTKKTNAELSRKLSGAREKVAEWILKVYKEMDSKSLPRGEGDRTFATDVLSWGVLSLDAVRNMDPDFSRASGLSQIDLPGLFQVAQRAKATVDYEKPAGEMVTVTGYRFTTGASSPLSAEWTGEVVVAGYVLGKGEDVDPILADLGRMAWTDIARRKSIPYAHTPGKTFPDGWTATRFPSVASNAWYLWAQQRGRFNPFDLLAPPNGRVEKIPKTSPPSSIAYHFITTYMAPTAEIINRSHKSSEFEAAILGVLSGSAILLIMVFRPGGVLSRIIAFISLIIFYSLVSLHRRYAAKSFDPALRDSAAHSKTHLGHFLTFGLYVLPVLLALFFVSLAPMNTHLILRVSVGAGLLLLSNFAVGDHAFKDEAFFNERLQRLEQDEKKAPEVGRKKRETPLTTQPLEEFLVDWALNIKYEDLPEEAINAAKDYILNANANSVRAFNYNLGRSTRQRAMKWKLDDGRGATIFGTTVKTVTRYAMLYLGALTRDLDWDSTYLGEEPSHPDDNQPLLLTVAEQDGKSGKDVILASVIAQEAQVRFADAIKLRDKGIDHVSYLTLSAILGLARLKGLNRAQMIQALNIGTQECYKLRGMRQGPLNTLKSYHAALAQDITLHAVEMAETGDTGPTNPFETKYGFNQQLLQGSDLRDFVRDFPTKDNGLPYAIVAEVFPKGYQAEYHAQSAIEAAIELHHTLRQTYSDNSPRDKGLSNETLSHVRGITLETFEAVLTIISKDKDRSVPPKNRETADHDISYMLAHALVYGYHDESAFTSSHRHDARVQRLRAESFLNFVENPEATKRYYDPDPKRKWNCNRIKLAMDNGEPLEAKRENAFGHSANPWPHDDKPVDAIRVRELAMEYSEGKMGWLQKASGQLINVYGAKRTAELINRTMAFDQIPENRIGDFMQSWAIPPSGLLALTFEEDPSGYVPAPLKPRVLYLEDDHSVRELTLDVLEPAGYDVITVSNGKEALDEIKRSHEVDQPFDVIVADGKMPETNGVEFYRQLVELYPNEVAKLIFFAGQQPEGEEGLDRVPFIQKLGGMNALQAQMKLTMDRAAGFSIDSPSSVAYHYLASKGRPTLETIKRSKKLTILEWGTLGGISAVASIAIVATKPGLLLSGVIALLSLAVGGVLVYLHRNLAKESKDPLLNESATHWSTIFGHVRTFAFYVLPIIVALAFVSVAPAATSDVVRAGVGASLGVASVAATAAHALKDNAFFSQRARVIALANAVHEAEELHVQGLSAEESAQQAAARQVKLDIQAVEGHVGPSLNLTNLIGRVPGGEPNNLKRLQWFAMGIAQLKNIGTRAQTVGESIRDAIRWSLGYHQYDVSHIETLDDVAVLQKKLTRAGESKNHSLKAPVGFVVETFIPSDLDGSIRLKLDSVLNAYNQLPILELNDVRGQMTPGEDGLIDYQEFFRVTYAQSQHVKNLSPQFKKALESFAQGKTGWRKIEVITPKPVFTATGELLKAIDLILGYQRIDLETIVEAAQWAKQMA